MCVKAIDEAVKGQEFICGDFSAADIMLGYSMLLIDRLAPTDAYPEAARYWQGLQTREACQTAIR